MSMLTKRLLSLTLIILITLGSSSGCAPPLPAQKFRLLAFGTYIDVEVIGINQPRAEAARRQLQQDFDLMHHAWHAWEPGPLGYVNASIRDGVQRIAAPPSTLPLIKISQELARQSDYLFDPGIGQLVKLWDFHRGELTSRQPPELEAIDALLSQQPSICQLAVDGFHINSNNPAVQLDFGAIGKGYGVDQAILRLQEMGIDSAIVNAGGDLRAIGSRAGVPWRIAIRGPSGSGVLAWLPVSDNGAVFTSGDYERNFTWDGEFYHHIIDPRTGYPAEGAASVTVLHTDATTADAAATALFIAGPEDWPQIARQMGIDQVLLVDTEGQIHMTEKMQNQVKLRPLTKQPRIVSFPE